MVSETDTRCIVTIGVNVWVTLTFELIGRMSWQSVNTNIMTVQITPHILNPMIVQWILIKLMHCTLFQQEVLDTHWMEDWWIPEHSCSSGKQNNPTLSNNTFPYPISYALWKNCNYMLHLYSKRCGILLLCINWYHICSQSTPDKCYSMYWHPCIVLTKALEHKIPSKFKQNQMAKYHPW